MKRTSLSKRRFKASKTGVTVKECYCRKCMQTKDVREFYSAVDIYLDANGYFSVCKQCVNQIYNDIFSTEKSMEIAILRICRMLNLRYSEEAIEATKTHLATLQENGKTDTDGIVGIYKVKLTAIHRSFVGDNHPNLTYEEVTSINVGEQVHTVEAIEHDVVDFWGAGYTDADYEWLEKELDKWKATHKADTQAEQILLREIVFKQFEIEKARAEKKSTASLVKELQDLMKTASVDPAKTTVAGSGKSQDTFGNIVKLIEETEPAEYYQDKEIFKDVDNIGWYFYNYIVRPLKNFITGSRDFTIDDSAGENTDETELSEIEIISEPENELKQEE